PDARRRCLRSSTGPWRPSGSIGRFAVDRGRQVLGVVALAASPYTGSMSTNSNPYKYLARKPKSVYKQLFIKDRWISARTLYGKHVREEAPMTLEEIATDYDLPLEAVREAIAYGESNP